MNLQNVTSRILKDGGITYDCRGQVQVRSGFAVSPYKRNERVIPMAEFGHQSVRQYVEDNAGLLILRDHYLGAWIDGSSVYLDVAVVVSSMDEARETARAASQLAFFCLDTFTTHETEQVSVAA